MNIKEINSKTNQKIKILKKLSQKKYRKENNLFLLENFVSIFDAFSRGIYFKELYFSEEFFLLHQEKIEEIIKKSKSLEVYKITNEINKSFSNLDTASGIAAVYEIN